MNHMMGVFSALGLGALHALEPGHGKGVMGAYLIMSRGRPADAVLLGLTTAVTHTLVVVLLAVLARTATGMVATGAGMTEEHFNIWLRLISGVLIFLIGIRLWLLQRRAPGTCCGHHARDGSHGHRHTAGWRRVDLGSLLMVGISNGLMPCPGALAVLLLSISAGTLTGGLLLVFAFGVGAALAMTVVGLAFVKLSHLAGGITGSRSWRGLTLVSAALIMLIGAASAYHAGSSLMLY